MSDKIYVCKITNYRIEYKLENDNAYMEYTYFGDMKHPKAFIQLLRSSIDDLKEHNIKYVYQSVTNNDWNLFLKDKTKWTVINEDNVTGINLIKCEIDLFLENMGVGLGFFK